jgi:hypothetical protein
MQGVLILFADYDENKVILPCPSASGVYAVRISTTTGNIVRKIIIHQ